MYLLIFVEKSLLFYVILSIIVSGNAYLTNTAPNLSSWPCNAKTNKSLVGLIMFISFYLLGTFRMPKTHEAY